MFIKLAGVYPPDSGTIELRGDKQVFKRPIAAKQKGIAVIYQEFTLFPDLDVAKNIYFGMEPHFITFDRDKWKGGRGGGNDDYYNNGEYRTGFSYFNRGVGSRCV